MKNIFLSLILTLTISLFFNTSASEQIIKNSNRLKAPSAVKYKWYFNNNCLEGLTNAEIIVLKEGNYRVEFIDIYGIVFTQEINTVSAGTPRKLFVIGDSTSSIYDESKFPRTGWGQILQSFFNVDSIKVIDKALSGRSSKSFYSDASGWPVVLKDLGAGDFLFIQFGHNDEKIDDRHTDPYTTFQQYLSIYIDSARGRGALPVLLTPIHRNNWSEDQINDSHGDYPPAMRQLAIKKNVSIIDLTIKTEQLFENLGTDYVTNQIFLNLPAGVYSNYPDGNSDNTHLQLNGAFEVCNLICAGIDTISTNDTLNFLKDSFLKVSLVELLSDPNTAGTLAGKGVFATGNEVNIIATHKKGFLFLNWTEKDTIVSDTSSYKFIMPDHKRTLTAHFLPAFNVSIQQTILSAAEVYGTGYYGKDSVVIIRISPKQGYKFTHLSLNDSIVSTDTIYSFKMTDKNLTFIANFEKLSSNLNDNQNSVIEIFPNPFSTSLTIRGETEIVKFDLIDINGRLIFSKNCTSFEYHLDELKYFSKGETIFARIVTNDKTFIYKIHKM